VAIFEVFVYQRAGINSPARGTLTDTGGAIEFLRIQSLVTRETNIGPGWRLARAIQALQPNPIVLFRTIVAFCGGTSTLGRCLRTKRQSP